MLACRRSGRRQRFSVQPVFARRRRTCTGVVAVQPLRAFALLRWTEAVTVALEQDRLAERLRRLGRDELLAMYAAAADVTESVAALAESGKNPVTEVLGAADVVEEWSHFPPGDVIDAATQSQYYYHAHAAAERVAGEHGHFHTFVRPQNLDPTLRPAALSKNANADDPASWVMHLAGISTDASGRLIRLFTTNRWVTDEAWYGADDVIGMIDNFDMTGDTPSPELSRWVTGVTGMFRPQIADLVRKRDEVVVRHRAAHPGRDVFEDRDLQVTSEMSIDFLTQVRAIEAALESKS